MAIRRSIKGNQARSRLLKARVDGSAVTTSAATTGMSSGDRHNMTILKGSGGTSNEVTVAFNTAFAVVPVVVATPITTNCHIEIKSVSASQIVFETFQVADGTTDVNDADFHFIVIGEDTSSEYKE